jgi:hypothetical protein
MPAWRGRREWSPDAVGGGVDAVEPVAGGPAVESEPRRLTVEEEFGSVNRLQLGYDPRLYPFPPARERPPRVSIGGRFLLESEVETKQRVVDPAAEWQRLHDQEVGWLPAGGPSGDLLRTERVRGVGGRTGRDAFGR